MLGDPPSDEPAADPQFPACLASCRFPHRCPRCWTMRRRGETGVTFYSVRGEILSALRLARGPRAGPCHGPPADRRGLCRGRADPDHRRHLAGLLRRLLRRPICRPAAGAGLDPGRDRRQGGLSRPAAPPARRLRRGGGGRRRRSRRLPRRRRRASSPRSACMAAWPRSRRCRRSRSISGRFGPAELCYLQFSSGSTRLPHGVEITQRALMANLAGITGPAGLDVVAGDRAVTWLPLYHDMGLVGFMLAPLSSQLSVDYLTPRDFARRPTAVADADLAQPRHHLLQPELRLRPRHAPRRQPGAGRPRPVELARRRHRRRHDPARRARPLRRDLRAGGLRPQGLHPELRHGRGLPRHHLRPLGTGVRIDAIDRAALADSQRAVPAADRRTSGARGASCSAARSLPGHRLEVRGEDGRSLPDRGVGRIFVRGPERHGGLFRQPEATREVLSADGWLDTGDLGYMLDGRDRHHRPRQGPDHRQRPQHLAAGHRMGGRDAPPWLRRGDVAAFSIDDGRRRARRGGGAGASAAGEAERAQALARDVAGAVQRTAAVDCDVDAGAADHGPAADLVGQARRARAPRRTTRRPLRAQDPLAGAVPRLARRSSRIAADAARSRSPAPRASSAPIVVAGPGRAGWRSAHADPPLVAAALAARVSRPTW